jgi:hypothetical protein
MALATGSALVAEQCAQRCDEVAAHDLSRMSPRQAVEHVAATIRTMFKEPASTLSLSREDLRERRQAFIDGAGDDPVADLVRSVTALPRGSVPAADLTDGQKVALALAAGLPYRAWMDGTQLRIDITVPFGVADRGDGGYLIASRSAS